MRSARLCRVFQRRVQRGAVDQVECIAAAAVSSPQPCASSSSPDIPGTQQWRRRAPWQQCSRRWQHAEPSPAAVPTSATMLSGMAVELTDGDPFLKSIVAPEGPLRAYKDGRQRGAIRKDPRQENTMLKIQRVYDDLKQLYPDTAKRSGLTLGSALPVEETKSSSWFGSWFGGGSSRQESTDAAAGFRPKGLYMYGGVGVGKTMLMDLLAQYSPPQFKLERTHYHDFMLDVHGKLRHYQKTADPLALVADEIMDATNVLCLDEFFVTDVADAMILHRLFGRLWDRRLVLVATSNRHPDSLYEGGLQRNLFLPFIDRLKEECMIHDMNSQTDYRRLASHHRGLYFVTPTREEDLYERFIELTNNKPVEKRYVDVAMGRQLEVPRAGGCIALFDFKELCDRPLAAADYIALANSFHTVAISGVPVFTGANRTTAYRFVTLIDVFYEHRTRVLMSAEAMPFELFENIKTQEEARAASRGKSWGGVTKDDLVVDDNLGFAKDRTISRLTEMQSQEYLIAHAKQNAPELLLALEEAFALQKQQEAARPAH